MKAVRARVMTVIELNAAQVRATKQLSERTNIVHGNELRPAGFSASLHVTSLLVITYR